MELSAGKLKIAGLGEDDSAGVCLESILHQVKSSYNLYQNAKKAIQKFELRNISGR